MADRPDFLVETRYTFGTARWAQGVRNCIAGDVSTFATIEGKGITLGGFIKCSPDETHNGDYVYLLLDGRLISSHPFFDLIRYNLTTPGYAPIFIRDYDETNFRYGLCISSGLTFETELKVQYRNFTADSYLVSYHIYYALI